MLHYQKINGKKVYERKIQRANLESDSEQYKYVTYTLRDQMNSEICEQTFNIFTHFGRLAANPDNLVNVGLIISS